MVQQRTSFAEQITNLRGRYPEAFKYLIKFGFVDLSTGKIRFLRIYGQNHSLQMEKILIDEVINPLNQTHPQELYVWSRDDFPHRRVQQGSINTVETGDGTQQLPSVSQAAAGGPEGALGQHQPAGRVQQPGVPPQGPAAPSAGPGAAQQPAVAEASRVTTAAAGPAAPAAGASGARPNAVAGPSRTAVAGAPRSPVLSEAAQNALDRQSFAGLSAPGLAELTNDAWVRVSVRMKRTLSPSQRTIIEMGIVATLNKAKTIKISPFLFQTLSGDATREFSLELINRLTPAQAKALVENENKRLSDEQTEALLKRL